jgi:SHO1 osmosensor
LAWLIAFISSVIADIRSPFPNYAWWGVVYMLFCILGVLITVASDSTQTYGVAVREKKNQNDAGVCFTDVSQIVGFLAAGLVFTTSAVNSLVYSPDGAKEAAAAGHILLSMVAV